MPASPVRFSLRNAFFLLLCLCVCVLGGAVPGSPWARAALAANPYVVQGASVTFTATGSNAPTSSWGEIRNPAGQVVATFTSPPYTAPATVNGWTLYSPISGSYSDKAVITLTAPATASVGQSYEVRTSSWYYATSSQFFDVIPSGPYLAAPTLSGTAQNGAVALSWNAVNSATSYSLYRATTSGGYTYATPLTTTATTSYSDTGLSNGTAYYYVVQASNATLTSASSNEVKVTPAPPPAAPTGLSATGRAQQVSLSWTASSGATAYIVQQATAAAGPFTSLSPTTTSTYYTNSGLANSTTYYYQVIAANSSGQSPPSAVVSATTLAPPPAPTGLTAMGGTGQVVLSWTAIPNTQNSYNTYSVKRATTTGGPYAIIASNLYSASYTDTGLTNGATYYYVVSASNAAGPGPNSSEVSAMPLAVPTGLTATGGKARVDLSWNVVAGATGYQVFAASTSGGYTYSTPLARVPTGTTYSDSSLTSDARRYYVVRATNANGQSNSSVEVNARPLVPVKLNVPLANTSGQGVTLSWTANTFPGFVSYVIYRSTQAGVTPQNGILVTTITNQATTTFADPAPQAAATPGNSYFYIVVVNSNANESVTSNEASVTLTTSDLLLRLSASPGDGQANLEWGYGTATNTQGITGYGVKRAPATGGPYTTLTTSLSATTSTYPDTGLTNGTTYYYRVFPILANGNGPASNEASVVPVRAIPTGDIVLTGSAMNQSIRLGWNAGARAVQYVLWRRVGTGDWSQLATVNPAADPTASLSYTDPGLTNGTIYAYRVRAGNEEGDSTDSNIVSLLPNPSAPLAPGAPTFGTATSTSLVVNAPPLPFGATSLSVYMGVPSGPNQIQTPVATNLTAASPSTFTVSNLTPGTSYTFDAVASNAFGSTTGRTAYQSTTSMTAPTGPPATPGAPVASVFYAQTNPGSSPATYGHIITVAGVTSPGATSMAVQWKIQGDPDSVFLQSGHEVALPPYGGSSAQIQPMQASTTHILRLKASNTTGTAPNQTTNVVYGPTTSVTTLPDPPAAPPAPVIPSATISSNSVVVNVPALPTGATSLTLYWGNSLYFDTGSGTVRNGYSGTPGSFSVPAGSTTVTVNGLPGGQALRFLWLASNVTASTPSPTTTVTTQAGTLAAPDAPAFLNLLTDSLEIIVPANVFNSGGPSGSVQLQLQGKLTGTNDSTYQTVLFAQGNPGDSYRVSSASGTAALNEHPEVGPMDLQRRLLVTNLTPGQSYTFRFVATSTNYSASPPVTSQVNGAPNAIVMPTEALSWSPGPPILCSGIRYPWTGMTAKSGGVYHLNSYSAADWDILTHTLAGFSWNQVLTGPCVYGWSADSGTFPEGIKGPNVLWQAPPVTTPTDVTLYLQVTPVGAIGRRESGTRNTTPILPTDRPGQFEVTVHVNP